MLGFFFGGQSYTGQSPSPPFAVLLLSASISGDANSSASVYLKKFLAGTASGDATASSTPPKLIIKFSGSVSGDASVAAALILTAFLQGTASGDSATTAIFGILHKLQGTATGDAIASAIIGIKLVFSPSSAAGDSDTLAYIFLNAFPVVPTNTGGYLNYDSNEGVLPVATVGSGAYLGADKKAGDLEPEEVNTGSFLSA